jgi:pyrroloquinoline-quinone synthase
MKPVSSSSLMKTCREITQTHPLWNHEFLLKCRKGQLTLLEVRVLAVQMYQFSKNFNRILAGIMSCCPDTSAQLVILENLYDEMGNGDPDRSHPELFRRFT